MKLKARKTNEYRQCSGCGERKDTRALNIRYQDFKKTYKRRDWGQPRPKASEWHYWFYNTRNYDLCEKCQQKFVKKLQSLTP